MKQRYQLFVVLILILLWGIIPTYAQDTHTCEVYLSGIGEYTCSFEAEAGDVIETSCDGCSGTGFLGTIGWRLYSPSGATLLNSDSSSTRVTLNSAGTYEFWARYDFGVDRDIIRGRCGLKDDAGYEYCEEDIINEIPRSDDLTITIRWVSRATPPTSVPVTSDTTTTVQTDSTDTTSATNDSASSFDISLYFSNLSLPVLVFLAGIIGGLVSLVITLIKRKFWQGLLVVALFWGGTYVYLNWIDKFGFDKVLDYAITVDLMTLEGTMGWRPAHNIFEITDFSEILLGAAEDHESDLCIGGESQIFFISANESAPILLGIGLHPTWLPDSSEFAFACNGISSVDSAGQNEQQITSPEAAAYDPHFSPDGSQILFELSALDSIGERREDGLGWILMVADIDGSNQQEIDYVISRYQPQWSPDSSQIAYITVQDDLEKLVVVNADGSNRRELYSSVYNLSGSNNRRSFYSFVWSPDSQRIAFIPRPEEILSSLAGPLIIMDSDGRNETIIHDVVKEISWLPDSSGVWFNARTSVIEETSANGFPRIEETYSLLNSNTMETVLPFSTRIRGLTPDESQIFFSRYSSGRGYRYYVMSIEDGQLRRVGIPEAGNEFVRIQIR